MTRPFIGAAVIIALCSPAAADKALGGGADGRATITVSCFRGPLDVVVWDRPRAVFIDSLVAAGYDYAEATAIGTRVCRDEALLNDRGALASEMRRIYNTTR